MQTDINLPFITADASGPKHLTMTLTRAKLEALVADLIDRTVEPCRQAMKDAGVTAAEIDEVVLVGGQTRMPKVQDLVKQTFGRDAHKGVNPDEVVAIGAAVQGAVLAGDVKGVVLLDVTPLSLGVETLGGVMTVLIPRNTTIPARKSEVFSTATDNQTSVDIHVLQGERPLARDNRTLGRFHLVGIAPAPRGMPQIEVTFDIDANGILNVSAKDMATGKQQQITITASSGLSKEEVERMVKDAEAHAADDARRREEIELRNQTDALVYSTEHTLREHGARLSPAERANVEQALGEARDALAGDDMDRIRRAQDALTQASRSLAGAAHRDAQQAAHAGARQSGGTAEGDVVDAEVVDTDDRKR
jgi:molecular chaperone DnaK